MKLQTYQDVEKYLSFKEVYFREEICDIDFKTIVEANKVEYIGKVEIKQIRENTIFFSLTVKGKEVNIITEKKDAEFFEFIKTNFIPVSEMFKKWIEK
jgi:predicted nucleotidyltransferase